MNKISKYENMIKSLQNTDQQQQNAPCMYEIVLHNSIKNSNKEIKNLLQDIFHFSAEEIDMVSEKEENKNKIICGSYTKEILDTKLFDINQLSKKLNTSFDFTIKIK